MYYKNNSKKVMKSVTQKIDANHSKLENLVKIGRGMQSGANDIFVFKDKPLQFPKDFLKNRINGNQIDKYTTTLPTEYILYLERINEFEQLSTSIQQYLLNHKTQLANRPAKKKKPSLKWWNYTFPTHKNYYHLDKLWCSSKSVQNGFSYDDNFKYIGLTDTMVIFDTNKDISLKYLLALLNSSLLLFRHKVIEASSGGGKSIAQLPIVTTDKVTQQRFITFVDYIIYLKQQPFYRSQNLELKEVQDRLMVSFFEQIIDGMVYELYFPEALHQGEKYFLNVLAQENLPALAKMSGEKMTTLRRIFQRLFDKEHPLRHNLFFLDSLPIIRMIEGKPYYADFES
jgi:hypothetical protein